MTPEQWARLTPQQQAVYYQQWQQQPQTRPAPTPPPRKSHKGLLVTLASIIAVLVVIGMASGGRTTTRAVGPQTSTATTPQQVADAPAAQTGPATSVGDGTYQVGADMAAGRYKTPGPPADAIVKDCYWARNRTDSGQFSDIIANGNAQGPGSVTVKQGEFFETSGGCTWTKQ